MKVFVAKAEMNTSKRIAFIGLGAMGEPMAQRLMDAGFTVTSCANRSREAIERLGGGDEAIIAQCDEVFSAMGNAVRCGDVGAGQLTKVANDTLFMSTFALLQELREVIDCYGMDFKQFIEVLDQSTGRSWVSENVGIPRQRVALPAMPNLNHDDAQAVAEQVRSEK